MNTLSIVIPTLNEELFLPKLLGDIEKQTDRDFELIIVDAKSEDNTKKEVSLFFKKIPLTFIESDKRSVAYQRNLGAKHASGTYVFFLDADSRIPKNYVRQLKKYIVNNPSLMYIPALITKRDSRYNIAVMLLNYLSQMSLSTRRPLCTGGSMIINKSFFSFIGGFDESVYVAEDGEILVRAKKYGVTASFIKTPYIHVSVRRIEYEGYISLIKKYILVMVHSLRNKDGIVKNKIFEYEMGGLRYKQPAKQDITLDKTLKELLNKFSKLVN
jgi:glycosyltransferase involved in cell wall biosynthesis